MCHLNLEENSEVGSRNLIIIIYIYIYYLGLHKCMGFVLPCAKCSIVIIFDKAMQLLTKLLVISVGKSVWAKLDMVWWPGLVEELGEKQIVVSFFDEDAE